jgi:hypothetical protein
MKALSILRLIENSLNNQSDNPKGDLGMDIERFIHAAVFALLIVGLYIVSGWLCYQYIGELVLKIAGITLSWAIILLALYLAFKKLDWGWWS